MPVNTKSIRERVTRMSNGWAQGAPNVTVRGITQPGFQADIDAAAAVDQEIVDLETQVRMKTNRDERYKALNENLIKIRDGFEGHDALDQTTQSWKPWVLCVSPTASPG